MMFSINFCVDIFGGECPLVAKVRWADADLLDFIWFESEWGFCSSMMSLLISAMAHKWTSLTKPAVILMEVAWCFNSMIFTVFCVYILPVRLAPQHGWKPFEMSYVHALPTISSFTMLILTDMVFLKRDTKFGILGFIYICFNGLGTIYKGKPVYSGVWVASWQSIPASLSIGVLQTIGMSLSLYYTAKLLQKIRGFDEEKEQFNFPR